MPVLYTLHETQTNINQSTLQTERLSLTTKLDCFAFYLKTFTANWGIWEVWLVSLFKVQN